MGVGGDNPQYPAAQHNYPYCDRRATPGNEAHRGYKNPHPCGFVKGQTLPAVLLQARRRKGVGFKGARIGLQEREGHQPIHNAQKRIKNQPQPDYQRPYHTRTKVLRKGKPAWATQASVDASTE
ncbi:MAG: hypothetical protein RMJ56_07105 [Gemmataceae bacterium]|nr:hypothetical protein [Gemmata sp.]MDW8197358.1 hypothetical protein [Gemmataceae bacterium]